MTEEKKKEILYLISTWHEKDNASSATANDPKSKINASLRVWECRC